MKFTNSPILAMLLMLCVVFGCDQAVNNKQFLPTSTGELAELVLIYDKAGSTPVFKEEIREIFGPKIKGLPEPSEARFKVLFTDESFFKGYFKEHHNIFILLTTDNLNRLKATYGEANKSKIEEVMHNPEALGFVKKDIWARNQNVFYITAPDEKTLLQKMQSRADEILSSAVEHEQQSGILKLLTISPGKDSFYKKSMEEKAYGLRVPPSYRLAINKPEFKWLRKESSKYSYGIMIYDEPYRRKEQFSADSVIARRNRYTRKFIPGEAEGSYMKVAEAFDPYYSEINFKDHYAIEMKGWWDVQGDYMGGPFVLYSIYDEVGQRIITVEGYVYAPNKDKGRALREIEIILGALKIK